MEIDLVYLWVDGNDPVWLAKKNTYLPADRQVPFPSEIIRTDLELLFSQ